MHPEVATRLAEVLSEMEPFYHKCFIDMYKVMVTLFFTPPPSLFPVGSMYKLIVLEVVDFISSIISKLLI